MEKQQTPFDIGYRSNIQGIPIDKNPYQYGTESWQQWNNGWLLYEKAATDFVWSVINDGNPWS